MNNDDKMLLGKILAGVGVGLLLAAQAVTDGKLQILGYPKEGKEK